MKKRSLYARGRKVSNRKGSLTSGIDELTSPARAISRETLDKVFRDVGQKLREGHSGAAERLLTKTIENYRHTDDDLAGLKRLLSFTLETLGKYRESLDVIRPYENPEILGRLNTGIQVRISTQLAIAYNNLGDHPKAVTLLKETLENAREANLQNLLGNIEIGLARVYRKLNESNICRDHGESALNHFRRDGNWLGMAEAYREIAISYHQEGNSERSLEYFKLGIEIIGNREAPFMLGKLYTDMSGAFWFLRRAHEGISSLEKSIEYFGQTEHVLNSVIAYNNLGLSLMHVGDWARAEEMIRQALDLAIETDHAHIAGILDSLGELKLLRGELEEARTILEQSINVAREKKREWYEIQAMRNLARCMFNSGEYREAADKARETIELCKSIGDKHYANMAGLVLAESCLQLDNIAEAENVLQMLEENDPNTDFYVLGNIQRIRGLIAAQAGDKQLAVHHFNRSLTIFESAEDIYHTALCNLLLGEHLPSSENARALKCLAAAEDVFRRLGTQQLADTAAETMEKRRSAGEKNVSGGTRSNSVVSQLLMVRLAEATASRELLFRELISVLRQESKARKILIVETNDKRRLIPFITHGYSTTECTDLVLKFEEALQKGAEKGFARAKNIAVLPLRPTSAPHGFLIIYPAAGAVLNDNSLLQPLLRVVELGMDVIALRERDKSRPAEQEISPYTSSSLMPGFIHSSPAMTSLVEEVYKIRSSDVTVLVTGESGTGKELVSRAIHTLSNRKDKVFVPFNCTAVPKELAEGYLFGYRKGAFTGAYTDSLGVIRAADGGTLFLDEIGDLPIEVQPKILRFLQEGEVQPIGERRPIKVDVRIIAATNTPLEKRVADGTFREDLYYRLNVIRLRVPPLRERRSEIPPIVNYYVNHYSSRFGKRDITFMPQTIDLLMVCDWEGNVRQLCNEVQRIVARAEDGEVITPDHLSPELRRTSHQIAPVLESGNVRQISSFLKPVLPFTNISSGGTLEEAVTELEMQMIRDALSRHGWNISRVANELGLTRRGLYLKLSRYGIEKAA